MNNDYKIMQLINHDIHVITNEFDKILIIPCSSEYSASHENNNHVVLCHRWLLQQEKLWQDGKCLAGVRGKEWKTCCWAKNLTDTASI